MRTFFAALLLLTSLSSIAQTADELVDKHLAAIGGKEIWKKVTSMTTEGSMEVQGANVLISSKGIQDKGIRQDISVMGMSGYTIMTPTAGWSYMPWTGQTKAEPISETALKEGADQFDVQGILVEYKAKGHKVEYLGTEDYEGKSCHKLKITQKSGKVDTYFLDPTTYYLLKSVSTQQVNGQSVEGTIFYSDYQKTTDGYVVAMIINMPINMGMNVDLKVSKVGFNQTIDESIFKPASE